MRLRSEAVLAPLGLRARHLMALAVLRDGGGSTQQALAAILEMDGTNIVGLLNDLEAEDLIERRRSPEDRRRHMVELTEAERDAAVESRVRTVIGRGRGARRTWRNAARDALQPAPAGSQRQRRECPLD
jgi:DNA-binding MarR family transcriptional regulator